MMRMPRRVASTLALVAAIALAGEARGQQSPRLQVERGDGTASTVALRLDRGYAVVPLSVLSDLGWDVVEDEGGITLSAAGEITVAMRLTSPFFRWDGVVLQMTDAPYRAGAQTFVPVQFLSDFLPRRLPGLYDFDGERFLLRAGNLAMMSGEDLQGAAVAGEDPAQAPPGSRGDSAGRPSADPASGAVGAAVAGAGAAGAGAAAADPNSAETVRSAGPSGYDGVRVVVIDPGHGGADPGALGLGDVREKAVALEIGLRLAEYLDGRPDLEVHLIRDDDTFVDVWERGLIATEIKGERPGVFVSIHANSFPTRREARGFETYFLSDARTEHERRVSAIENAPLSMSPDVVDSEQFEDLDFILRDLKNYEHAHWSEDLAGLVQDELDDFHPGPDRGVKQGVLAVLTNALMPSILVEIGYLSNPEEARELARPEFHASSAEAIGDAVLRFFERYPPGSGSVGGRGQR